MSDPVGVLVPFALLVLIFYLLVLRPARKRQRDFVQTQDSLREGQRIMLASGIYGHLRGLRDTEVDVEIAPGTVITVNRHAVAKVEDPVVGEDDPTA